MDQKDLLITGDTGNTYKVVGKLNYDPSQNNLPIELDSLSKDELIQKVIILTNTIANMQKVKE